MRLGAADILTGETASEPPSAQMGLILFAALRCLSMLSASQCNSAICLNASLWSPIAVPGVISLGRGRDSNSATASSKAATRSISVTWPAAPPSTSGDTPCAHQRPCTCLRPFSCELQQQARCELQPHARFEGLSNSTTGHASHHTQDCDRSGP